MPGAGSPARAAAHQSAWCTCQPRSLSIFVAVLHCSERAWCAARLRAGGRLCREAGLDAGQRGRHQDEQARVGGACARRGVAARAVRPARSLHGRAPLQRARTNDCNHVEDAVVPKGLPRHAASAMCMAGRRRGRGRARAHGELGRGRTGTRAKSMSTAPKMSSYSRLLNLLSMEKALPAHAITCGAPAAFVLTLRGEHALARDPAGAGGRAQHAGEP